MGIREEILAVCQEEQSKVDVVKVLTPRWPCGHVFVRTIALEDNDRLDELAKGSDGEVKEGRALGAMAIACACTEDGKPIFQEADMPALLKAFSVTTKRIAMAAIKLNGGDAESDLVGNSEGGQSDDSSST